MRLLEHLAALRTVSEMAIVRGVPPSVVLMQDEKVKVYLILRGAQPACFCLSFSPHQQQCLLQQRLPHTRSRVLRLRNDIVGGGSQEGEDNNNDDREQEPEKEPEQEQGRRWLQPTV